VEEEVEDTVWLQCEVTDSGIGIPESALPTLFEKYTQVSTTHARKYGGTGLGLAICKNLVELMGGSLTVTSKENHGSTFSFSLPFRVYPERSMSSGRLSDEVYDMMTKEEKLEGSDILASSKKVGYFHFTSKVPTSKPSSPSLSPLPSPSPNPPIPPSSSSSTWSDNRKQSNPEPKIKVVPRSRDSSTGRSSSRRKPVPAGKPVKPSALSFYQECSPEFMDCDSKAPGDQMEYIPGLSMPHCQVPAPVALKQRTGGSSRTPSSPSKVRSPRDLAGQGRKVGKTNQGSTMLPPAAQDVQPHKQSRILLAEDNKVNVMVAQSMMQRLGHKLEVVSNGAEAIEAVKRNTYDVILMDVCMPVMDGLEATRRIRRYEATGSWDDLKEGDSSRSVEASSSNAEFGNTTSQTTRQRTPIIAMTANALADNMMECYMHGMDSFVAKPVTFKKLEQVLKQFISCLDRT
jgi:CheY-like chemotaxis protein